MCLARPPAPPPQPQLPPIPPAPAPPPPPPAPAPAPAPVSVQPGSAGEKVATIRGAASTRTRARQAAQGTAQLKIPQTTVTPAPAMGGSAATGLNIPK